MVVLLVLLPHTTTPSRCSHSRRCMTHEDETTLTPITTAKVFEVGSGFVTDVQCQQSHRGGVVCSGRINLGHAFFAPRIVNRHNLRVDSSRPPPSEGRGRATHPRWWPKAMTESSTLRNLRVVVTMVHTSAPNRRMQKKMNTWRATRRVSCGGAGLQGSDRRISKHAFTSGSQD